MVSFSSRIVFSAGEPSKINIFGLTNWIWRIKYGLHAVISSASGVRLFGGRHFTVLAINISVSLFKPTDSRILVNNWPVYR